MKKSRVFVLITSLLCLLFFFVASTTNLIIKDDSSKVYNIAILSDSLDGNAWSNYLKGVNVASKEYNVELTILNENSYEDVVSYLSRELRYKDNKIDGIVMAQDSTAEFEELVKEMKLPVVYVKNEVSSKDGVFIGVDSLGMGQEMAELIVNDLTGNPLTDPLQRAMVYLVERSECVDQRYCEGITSVLKSVGISYQQIVYSNVVELIELQEDIKKKEQPVVLLGCDAKSVEILIDVFGEELQDNALLYGNQCTNKILHYMEKKYVKAITVKDDYISGYLSVQKVVFHLDRKKNSDSVLLQHYLIRNTEIYEKENEAVLFPIP